MCTTRDFHSVDTQTLARIARTDRAASDAYAERMASEDAIERLLSPLSWSELARIENGQPIDDTEPTQSASVTEILALLAPIDY